ncbi:MAG: hypothetical protein WBD28_01045 [Candidatus Zixiibacteriota bacterium]
MTQLSSQVLARDQAELFILSTVKNNNLDGFVDQSELEISDRLGIQYEGVDNKYLISYDIEDIIKNSIKRNELDYTIETINLEANYSKVIFSISELSYQKEFYFKGGKYVSPISYHTRGWRDVESKHFRFLISDTTLFNSYCISNLENYFLKIARLLDFGDRRLKEIEAHKIYYILCKDEEEIKLLTGFNIRGMYNLAYDFVITTFNSHYHELLHLLINFKLQRLPLYTHPFFQEGFAVAFGGRGGKEPDVILSLGSFLYNSKMLDYSSLLSKNDFFRFDISLSYPVSGLYNKFLVEQIGIERYLELYRKYSGTADEVGKMKIHENELPVRAAWEEFLVDYSQKKAIDFRSSRIQTQLIYDGASTRIFEDFQSYYFNMRDTLLIGNDTKGKEYQSKKFHEVFKNRKYRGEKYLILVDANEISIYNLFTNNLIANYVSSFSGTYSPVPSENGLYYFSVRKHIFDAELKSILRDETD